MARPSVVVEFRAPGGTWRNVSAYTQSVNIDRGGDRDISEVSAGSCSVVLFNRDRRFDPKYTSSPYNGEIKPVGNVRVTMAGNLRFYGYITAWNYTYDVEGNSFAIISAGDGISEIAKKTLNSFLPDEELSGKRIDKVLSRPEVAWPFDLRALEGGANLHEEDVPQGTNALSYIQQCVSSEGGMFFADRQGKLTYLDASGSTVSYTQYRTNIATQPNLEGTTYSRWSPGVRSSNYSKFGTYSQQSVFVTADNQFVAGYSNDGGGNSGKWTASCWIYVTATSFNDYEITVSTENSGAPIAVFSKTYTLKGPGWYQISCPFDGGGPTWTTDGTYVSVRSSYAADGSSTTFYLDGMLIENSPYAQDYFDGSTVPNAPSYVTQTASWVGSANDSKSNMTIVTTLSNIAQTSFSASDATNATIPYSNIEMTYGAETLYNRVVIDWPWRNPDTQEPIEINDATSQAIYGIKSLEISDCLLEGTALRTARATAAITAFKDPEFRINSITIDAHALSSTAHNSLSLQDIGSGATVTFTPNKIGSAISPTAYTVIGISESITVDTYEMTFYLSASGSLGRVGGASV